MQARATFPSIVYILFRHKWTIIVTFLAVMSAAGAYCLLATEYYESECDLYVNFGRDTSSPVNTPSGVGQAEATLDQQTILNSLTHMLTSGSLVEEVITEIGLKELYPGIVAAPPTLGTPLGSAERRMINHDLKVQVAKSANIIQVIYNHPNAELAAKTANLLVNKFIARELAVLRDPRASFLQEQLEKYHVQLNQSEAALDEFRNHTGISSLDEERTLLLKQRADIESTLANNQAQVTEVENRKQVLQSELAKLPPNVEFADEDNVSQSQLVQLQIQREALLNNYRADSPTVRDLEKQIQKLSDLQAGGHTRVSKQLPSISYQDIEVDLNRAEAQLHGVQVAQSTLQQQHSGVVRRIAALDDQNTKLQDLERQYQIDDLNYRTYNQYFEQARIGEGLNKETISTISIIEPATPADRATYPRDSRILTMTCGLAVVLAFLTAFFLEGVDERLNLPVQVEDALTLPVLASVPRLRQAAAD
jgi:polysaccharide biosynthesis protein PslE